MTCKIHCQALYTVSAFWCHSWPELNQLSDYGDLSLYLLCEKSPCSLCLPVITSASVSVNESHVYKGKHRPTVYQMCFLWPHTTHTVINTHTPTETHRAVGKATCVHSCSVVTVCFTWLMIAQAVRAAERLCWSGLAACRAGAQVTLWVRLSQRKGALSDP